MADSQPDSQGYWSRQWRALVPFAIWAAYLAFFALHIVVRSFGDEFMQWRSPEGVDRALTGSNPSLWLQEHLYGNFAALDRVTTGAHLAWFAFPFIVGLGITVRQRTLLVSYFCWLTVTWFVCDALFFLFPATPPWMVDGEVTRVLFTRGWVDYASVDTNPVAAFPSLHASVPFVIGLFLWTRWREARWLAWTSWGFGLLVGFSVIYLGEHWLVDVVAGYAVAFGVRWLFISKPVRAAVSTAKAAIPGGTGKERAPAGTLAADDEQLAA